MIIEESLVSNMCLEAEKMSDEGKVSFFLHGQVYAIMEGMRQIEYWRAVVKMYPNLTDLFHVHIIPNSTFDYDVKEFIQKIILLK